MSPTIFFKLPEIDLKSFKYAALLMLAFLAFSLLPGFAHAQATTTTAATTLPWENFTAKVACTLSGPWVKWLAVIAIALGGIMFGLGELNGPFTKMMQIAGGFSVAVGALTIATTFLGLTGGAASCGALTSLPSIGFFA